MRQAGTGIPFHSNRAPYRPHRNRAFCPPAGACGSSMECRVMRVPAGYCRRRGSTCSLVGRWFKCSSPFFFLISGFLFAVLLFPLFPPPLFFHLCRLQALLHLYRMGFQMFRHSLAGMAQLSQPLCEDADLLGTGFVAIELLALLYEDSDFILRFLPNGGKLAPVLYVVLVMNSACSIRLSSLRISSRTA